MGYASRKGYLRFFFGRRQYSVHRFAWFYFYGEWPKGQIDHINGDPADNRISNLRCVTPQENAQNQKKAKSTNMTGLLGVTPSGSGFQARITIGGKAKHLGSFRSAQEAHEAYVSAKRQLHPANTL
jgi:hypothetical protein